MGWRHARSLHLEKAHPYTGPAAAAAASGGGVRVLLWCFVLEREIASGRHTLKHASFDFQPLPFVVSKAPSLSLLFKHSIPSLSPQRGALN